MYTRCLPFLQASCFSIARASWAGVGCWPCAQADSASKSASWIERMRKVRKVRSVRKVRLTASIGRLLLLAAAVGGGRRRGAGGGRGQQGLDGAAAGVHRGRCLVRLLHVAR